MKGKEMNPVEMSCNRRRDAGEVRSKSTVPFGEGADVGPTGEVVFGAAPRGRGEAHRWE